MPLDAWVVELRREGRHWETLCACLLQSAADGDSEASTQPPFPGLRTYHAACAFVPYVISPSSPPLLSLYSSISSWSLLLSSRLENCDCSQKLQHPTNDAATSDIPIQLIHQATRH